MWRLDAVPVEGVAGIFPVCDAAWVAANVGVAGTLEQVVGANAGRARVPGAIDDNLFVGVECGDRIVDRVEMERCGDALRDVGVSWERHHELESLAAVQLGPKLISADELHSVLLSVRRP